MFVTIYAVAKGDGMEIYMFEKIEQWKEDYIIVRHIFLDFQDYPNLKLSFPIGMFLILAAIAFAVSVFVINKKRQNVALTAKALLRYEALDESSAKALRDMHLDIPAVKSAILRGGMLASLVCRAGYKKPSFSKYEKMSKKERESIDKIDFSKELFYLNPDSRKTAEALAESSSSYLLKSIISAAVILIIFAVLFIVMPDLLSLINGALAE